MFGSKKRQQKAMNAQIEGHLQRGLAAYKEDRFQDAKDEALAVIRMKPAGWDDPMVGAWTIAILAELGLKQYATVLEDADILLQDVPEADVVWYAKGCALAAVERYDESLAAIERCLALDENFLKAWKAKGYLLLMKKRYEEVAAIGRYVLARNPNDQEAVELIELATKRQSRRSGWWEFGRSILVEAIVGSLFGG